MSGSSRERNGGHECTCDHTAQQHFKFFGSRGKCRYCDCAGFERKPINAKRIQLVRDFRMLEEHDWPDDMSGEKFGHFCMVTGFPVGFFRQGDPPEMSFGCCSSSYEDWLEEPLLETEERP
jgi:hypothetical protein